MVEVEDLEYVRKLEPERSKSDLEAIGDSILIRRELEELEVSEKEARSDPNNYAKDVPFPDNDVGDRINPDFYEVGQQRLVGIGMGVMVTPVTFYVVKRD